MIHKLLVQISWMFTVWLIEYIYDNNLFYKQRVTTPFLHLKTDDVLYHVQIWLFLIFWTAISSNNYISCHFLYLLDHLRGRPLPRGPPSPISPNGCPPFLPPRKRCNTVPSFTTEEGDTEWVELPDEKDEGYLIMKPAYDNKLKSMHTRSKSVPDEETAHSQTLPLTQRSWQTPSPRMQSPGTPTFSEPCSPIMEFIPQSPIHDAGDMRIQTLKRSATIGGFGRRAVRSPSFLAGRRPSLLRGSRQRRSLSSDPGNSHRTSDISLNSAPMPRRRRSDKYGSLDIRSMSLLNTRLEDFKDECQEVPPSPSNTTAFYPDDFQHLKGKTTPKLSYFYMCFI